MYIYLKYNSLCEYKRGEGNYCVFYCPDYSVPPLLNGGAATGSNYYY